MCCSAWLAVTCWQADRSGGQHVEPAQGSHSCALPAVCRPVMDVACDSDVRCWPAGGCPCLLGLARCTQQNSCTVQVGQTAEMVWFEALSRPSDNGKYQLSAEGLAQHSSLCPGSHMWHTFLLCLQAQQNENDQTQPSPNAIAPAVQQEGHLQHQRAARFCRLYCLQDHQGAVAAALMF